MVHATPKQDDIVEKSNWPTIRSTFTCYEVTFVILHPFLKLKPAFDIRFETGNWPTKEQIVTSTKKLNWSEIIEDADLKNISELDRLLAYLHCARKTADRSAWIKLNTILDKRNYIASEVDYMPAILINELMTAMKSFGYSNVNEYTEFDEFRLQHNIEHILKSKERDFFAHARIVTPDNGILLATDFDQRFSYLSSTRETVNEVIKQADLEGFFCNETTKADWSYIEQTEDILDWESPERYKNYA